MKDWVARRQFGNRYAAVVELAGIPFTDYGFAGGLLGQVRGQ